MVSNPIPTQILVELRILPNLVLETIKGDMFRNTKVMDKFIKCFSRTFPFRIKLGLEIIEPNFMLIYLKKGVAMKIFHISI